MGDGSCFSWAGVRGAVLANNAAGQSVRGDAADAAARVIAALRTMDADVPSLDDLAGGIPAQMEGAASSSPGVVLAAGGDGTVNAGARVAIRTGALLLAVPTGTMNLTAKDLCIPLELDRQVADLHRLVERRVDYGAVNGEVFLHSSAIGFIPSMAELREGLRASDSVGVWLGNAARFAGGLFSIGRNRVRMRAGGGVADRRTRSVLVSCNRIADAGLGEHRRAPLDGGTLGVYASGHGGPLGAIRLCLTLASGGIARDAGMDCGVCSSLEIRTDGDRITVSNDGELAVLASPLRYSVSRRGLRALVAADATGEIALSDGSA